MSNNINPVIINNPLGYYSSIILKPYQRLKLILTPEYGLKTVNLKSDFLEIISHDKDQTLEYYWLGHIKEVLDWTSVSQILLGEIKLIRENGRSCLNILLNSCNNGVITVIDPKEYDVCLRPSQLLEIVVLNNGSLFPVITKSSSGIEFIETLLGTVERRQFTVPSRSYFFRLATSIGGFPRGIYDAGSIYLSGNNLNQYKLFLRLKIKNKDRVKSKIFIQRPIIYQESYQEVDLLPKSFLTIDEGCNTLPTIIKSLVVAPEDVKKLPIYYPNCNF